VTRPVEIMLSDDLCAVPELECPVCDAPVEADGIADAFIPGSTSPLCHACVEREGQTETVEKARDLLHRQWELDRESEDWVLVTGRRVDETFGGRGAFRHYWENREVGGE
jgi:hypothetical protein